MLEFLRKLFMDETVFLRTARAVLAVLGMGIQNGTVPAPDWVKPFSFILVGAALFLGAGDKNPK